MTNEVQTIITTQGHQIPLELVLAAFGFGFLLFFAVNCNLFTKFVDFIDPKIRWLIEKILE